MNVGRMVLNVYQRVILYEYLYVLYSIIYRLCAVCVDENVSELWRILSQSEWPCLYLYIYIFFIILFYYEIIIITILSR